jgi:oligopeptide/dipeptide ABC transporter ATP-binding protein
MGVIAEITDEVAVMYAGQIVEQADTVELFEHAEHPYTEALLAALPSLERADARTARLATIPGRPPVLIDPPRGCRYAPRCAYAAQDNCAAEAVPLRPIRPGHLVRSLHPASERSHDDGAR